jgi:hypothetical protein
MIRQVGPGTGHKDTPQQQRHPATSGVQACCSPVWACATCFLILGLAPAGTQSRSCALCTRTSAWKVSSDSALKRFSVMCCVIGWMSRLWEKSVAKRHTECQQGCHSSAAMWLTAAGQATAWCLHVHKPASVRKEAPQHGFAELTPLGRPRRCSRCHCMQQQIPSACHITSVEGLVE